MKRFTANDVICHVHTRKQGFLSRIAHDLCFFVDGIDVEMLPDGTGSARVDPMAVRLLGVEHEGAVDRKLLSVTDQRRVLANLRQDVLDVRKFPQIVYRWTAVTETAAGLEIHGRIRLHGVERPLVFSGLIAGQTAKLTARLDQRDFGIVPFRAVMGALKVHPELRIELTVAVRLLRP